jgi:hypothetical protein
LIHVNQHIIKANEIHDQEEAPLTIKTYLENRRASEAVLKVDGKVIATLKYRRHKPLPCGARVWLEVESGVEIEVVR